MRLITAIILANALLFGCSEPNEFKSNCTSAAKILKEAEKRLDIVKAEEDPNDKSILVQLDNSKTREYLNSKHRQLMTNYKSIKSFYTEGGNYSFDALCAMAIINELKYHQDGEPLEDRCIYIKLIHARKSESTPSDWLLNDFYHYIFMPPGFKDAEWLKLNNEEKFDRMLESLLVPDEKGNNCINTKT